MIQFCHAVRRRLSKTVPAIVLLVHCGMVFGADSLSLDCTSSAISPLDHQRLQEVRRLTNAYCSELWHGWETAPTAVLLVTPACEYLVWHPEPTSDFQPLRFDSLLNSDVLVRKRVFDTTFQAAFPAVNGISTVVIGRAAMSQPMATVSWVLTVLHEHFHQWQQSDSTYGPQTIALGLSGGDKTGMWMLNYPFPYDSASIKTRFAEMSQALGNALDSIDTPGFRGLVEKFVSAREAFKQALAEKDYRYFTFQTWQEGVARYTEYRMAVLASTDVSSPAPDSLYRKAADMIRKKISSNLQNPDLGAKQRVAFYSVGAAEALLLDKIRPDWHNLYMVQRFSLDPYFPK
jgi:hypothetical protein